MSQENERTHSSRPRSSTGRNFAAGMTGGISYVVDKDGMLPLNCNLGSVELEHVDEPDSVELESLIEQHRASTGSTFAEDWLDNLPAALEVTTQVMPTDCKRASGS